MASPAIASVAVTDGSTATVDPTINLPASLASGDLCVVFFGATQTHGTPTSPTGWTTLVNDKVSGSGASGDRFQIMYRWCDGSEGTSLVVDTGTSSVKTWAIAIRITGGDTAVNPVISAGAFGNSNTPDPDSVTPSVTRDALFLALAAIEGTATAPSTPPTNYTHPSTFTQNTTGGGSATNARGCVAYRQITNTGAAEDPAAWGAWGASEDWNAWTMAIAAPAAGGGDVNRLVTWMQDDL
jgi:hypothetical protein